MPSLLHEHSCLQPQAGSPPVITQQVLRQASKQADVNGWLNACTYHLQCTHAR